MNKDLIKIIDQNIQKLKSSLGITEAHITWGTKGVSDKYTKIKNNILNKIREQEIDKNNLVDEYNNDVDNFLWLEKNLDSYLS